MNSHLLFTALKYHYQHILNICLCLFLYLYVNYSFAWHMPVFYYFQLLKLQDIFCFWRSSIPLQLFSLLDVFIVYFLRVPTPYTHHLKSKFISYSFSKFLNQFHQLEKLRNNNTYLKELLCLYLRISNNVWLVIFR